MSQPKRYCTFPNVPIPLGVKLVPISIGRFYIKLPWFVFFWLREWYERKFGDLCKAHDEAYAKGYVFGGCKTCADFKFVLGISQRGHVGTALVTLLVLLVWVPLWFKWAKRVN